MAQVKFVKLERQEKLQQLCRLADHFFQQGQRVLLKLQDENQAVSLDRFLWTCDKGSFLPHAFDNGSVECFQEPIVITTQETNPNGSSVLILGAPCSVGFLSQFEIIIDFAETYDPVLTEKSRDRFRFYRDQGFNPAMY
ncbi:MAG: DNA polymerase III subunit chi [Deltaproteobacteria bacterium]|nr:DNA polymerase III subunit chi [Deltaproteobacteria bacterium]MCW8892543.1 DNA polymerase III subunit chi [Deltaproteobacteria bacterium]MCW9049301.1 DNA polymerase III subunit chi [Deltaproteobacteria bacterium]